MLQPEKSYEVGMESLSPIIEEVVSAGGSVELTVTGNSMRPMMRHRVSKVRLEAITRPVKLGDVILYRRENGAYVLHRAVRYDSKDKDVCAMCGDNQYVIEFGIKREQMIAVMSGFSRDGKKWRSTESLAYKMYTVVWMAIRPLRRFIKFR